MAIIINLSETSSADLEERFHNGSGVRILNRRDLRRRNLLRTLADIRRRREKQVCFFCWDIDRQFNLFALKALALLTGARKMVFTDASARTRAATRAGFFFKDLPLTILAIPYLVVISLAFGLSSAALLILSRKAGGPAARARPSRTFCYLKTDFFFGLKAGGSVTHTRKLIEASLRSGYQPAVIAPDGLEPYRLPVKVTVIPPSRWLLELPQRLSQVEYNLRFTRGALGVIRKVKPAFLYQRCSESNASGVLLARLTGVPLVLEYNSSARWAALSGRRPGLVEDLCDRINLQGAAVIAVVSEELKSRLTGAGIAPSRILVNPNGVDTEAFCDTVDASAVKASLPAGKMVIGFIGTFGQWHGIMTLAQSVKPVLEQAPCAHFLIVGDGTLKDDMIATLRRDGVMGAVTFAGTVPHEEAPRYLNACDVLVSPHEDMADGSTFFGSPTKIFEYMAMGKGIVASQVGQLGRVFQNGRNALLVEQRNPLDLARAIVELIRDHDKRRALGREARRTAQEKYTWQHNFRRVVDHLAARQGEP